MSLSDRQCGNWLLINNMSLICTYLVNIADIDVFQGSASTEYENADCRDQLVTTRNIQKPTVRN